MANKRQSFWKVAATTQSLSRQQYIGMVNRFRFFVIIALLASLGVFILVALFGGFSNVLSTIGHANPYIYLFGFVCVFMSFCMRYLKWNYYTRKIGLKVPDMENFLVYLSTYAMNITPGNIGSVIAAYTLKKITGVKFAKIAPIVAVQLFTDFFGFALFALAASLIIGRYVLYVIVLDLVLIIPFMLIINPWLFNVLKNRRRKGRVLRRVYKYARHYYMSQNMLNNKSVYLVSLAFTVPADMLNSMALYFSLLAVGIKARIIASTFIFSIAQIFGMITGLPGGIGSADATFVALLKATFGLSSTLSSAVTIMARLATLWFGVTIGIIALVYTIKYWNGNETNKKRNGGKGG